MDLVTSGVLAPASAFTRASTGTVWAIEITEWTSVTAYPIYPNLNGETWGAKVTPVGKTLRRRSQSGRLHVLSVMQYPYYKIEIQYEYLDQRDSDYDLLRGFFEDLISSAGLFYLSISGDNTADHDSIGVSDGTVGPYRLYHQRGRYAQPIYGTFGLCTAYVNGAAVAATFPGDGTVIYAVAPAAGAELAWSGGYFYLCVFANDTQDFEELMESIYNAGSVQLETTMP